MPDYTVTFSRPWTHHAEFTLRVDDVEGPFVVWMPTWTPGSYLIREFAKNLRDLTAQDEHGRVVPIHRLDKARFRVDAVESRSVVISYRMFLNELSVRTSYVDFQQALLNGYSSFLGVEGRDHERHAVSLSLPVDWRAACALQHGSDGSDGSDVRFIAPDYHALGDAPIQCGVFERLDFEAAGKAHAFCIVGGGNYDGARLTKESTRLIEEAAALFGELPYEEYLFILQSSASGGGGLEHGASTVLQFPRFDYADPKRWSDLVTLISHEHFHVWNVKRIQPKDFRPYDLTQETYSRLLWVCEGITSYYDELLPVRAGVITQKSYFERLGETITRYEETPGRGSMTLEESSLTAWTRLYRPDADSGNSAISYYLKGGLVALLLDVEVRTKTDGARSLDDVLRSMHERFGPEDEGYSVARFEALCGEIADSDLHSFFDRYVRGMDELPLETALAYFGVSLTRGPREGGPNLQDLLGVRIPKGAARLKIDAVALDSPAERGKMAPGDEIIAIDGIRVRTGNAAKRTAERAGRELSVYLFRDDVLLERRVTPRSAAGEVWKCSVDPAASAEAVERRAAWLRSGDRSGE